MLLLLYCMLVKCAKWNVNICAAFYILLFSISIFIQLNSRGNMFNWNSSCCCCSFYALWVVFVFVFCFCFCFCFTVLYSTIKFNYCWSFALGDWGWGGGNLQLCAVIYVAANCQVSRRGGGELGGSGCRKKATYFHITRANRLSVYGPEMSSKSHLGGQIITLSPTKVY